MSKIVKPINPLIFRVAGELAAVWYEIGRGQGLTSKWKTPKAYANANIEKFIPKAVETLLDMLGPYSNMPEIAKMEIYEAITDPINDQNLMNGTEQLAAINAKKLDDIVKEHERYNKEKLGNIVTKPSKDTVLHNKTKANPFTPKAN